ECMFRFMGVDFDLRSRADSFRGMNTGPTRPRPLGLAALTLTLGLLGALPGTALAQGEAPPGVSPVPSSELPPRADNYDTARSVGMGLGSRAGSSGTTALVYNAANMPLVPLYHIE